jgi:predicted DNA-binding protein (UPF0251 family)
MPEENEQRTVGRPKKPRTCRRFQGFNLFKPAGIPMGQLRLLALGLDELEAMRLCDLDGLHQADAAERMGISRGTVQRLLESGRAKVVDAVAHGHALTIDEGEHVRILPPQAVRPGGRRRHGRGGRRGQHT